MISVDFNLNLPTDLKELSLPLMLARGYKRYFILECFSMLEEKGFGVFDKGTRGRSNYAKFFPNEKCPKKITINFKQKIRGRPKMKE